MKFKATVRHGALVVALAAARPDVGILIAYPELTATKILSSKVNHSTGKHPLTLTLPLAVTAADHQVTTLALKLDLGLLRPPRWTGRIVFADDLSRRSLVFRSERVLRGQLGRARSGRRPLSVGAFALARRV